MMKRTDKETPRPPVVVRVPDAPDGQEVIFGAYIGCPRCERSIDPQFDYCPRCGQHIKWE